MSLATKTIRQLREEGKQALSEYNDIKSRGDDRTPDDLVRQETLAADIEAIESELARSGRLDGVKSANALANTFAEMEKPARPPFMGNDGATLGGGAFPDYVKSVGERFLEDETFGAWLKSLTDNGQRPVPQKLSFTSPSVKIDRPFGPDGIKALITSGSSTSGGALITSDRRDLVVPYLFRPLRIRDVITTLQTTSDSIEYVRVTGVTNNAATVPEATATGNGTGVKPESGMALERVTESIKTIAHWMAATTRVLQDAPQLRGLVDEFLREGLLQKLEDLIVSGNPSTGDPEDFTGIVNTSGILTQAFTTDTLTTTRKARTKLRVTGRAVPNAWIMHPNDWEAFDLLKDGESRYYYGGPMVLGPPRLWGVPVVESEAKAEGTALLGDFRQCVLWDRMQTAISVSNQHSDFFIRNLVAILAEMRAGFGLLRPSSIIDADLAS